MTKGLRGRKRKGRKGRKGKGHIIIYKRARGRKKRGVGGGWGGRNTERGRGLDGRMIQDRYGGSTEKERKHAQHAPILFYKKRRKKDRLTTEADSLLERKGISRRLIVPLPEVLLTGVKEGIKKRKEKKYRR